MSRSTNRSKTDVERIKRFKSSQKRIVMDFKNDKAYFEWIKKPWWIQQAEEGDYIASGLDYQGYDNEEEYEQK